MSDLKIKTAAGKAPLAMAPLRAGKGKARVYAYGAKKYEAGNFLRASLVDGAGMRYMSAALRHASEMQNADGTFTAVSLAALDDESGLPHIDHMLCSLEMLRSIMVKDGVLAEDPGEGNDPPPPLEVVPPMARAERLGRRASFEPMPTPSRIDDIWPVVRLTHDDFSELPTAPTAEDDDQHKRPTARLIYTDPTG